jgi:serine/threonine-protein kinase
MPKFAPEEWRQVFELLDRALDMPRAEREAWLASLEQTRPQLQPALRDLLARHASPETNDFLQRLPQFTRVGIEHGIPAGLQPGTAVGPYRLIREIGQGGMGSVWLAERADGTFKRAVALKLPHVSWTGRLAEQMAREREILAALEHPHIARLYDAGLDASGRPFMAMEFAEGQPIDQYCRERNLPVAECLRLLLQVAQAVAYAHAKLVVHGDLKPSNILVTADGSVRLLDFGVARLLGEDTEAQARATRFGTRALTPDYASPEQIRGESIGTASDIYSLAMVCYELLTGTRPYRLRHASAAQLEQAITEADPLPASGATSDPARKRQLRGDLDAILDKALKKSPLERYPTLDAFAQDIERYLHHMPVLARPDGRLYRFRKLVARHRLALGAAAAFVLVLMIATGVSVWQARIAESERNRALRMLARNEAMNEFVGTMLTQAAAPDRSISLDSMLERSESLVSSGITNNPEHRAVILQMLAGYYGAFGNRGKSETLLRQASALARASNDAELQSTIECLHAFAESELGRVAEAQKVIATVLARPAISPVAATICLERRGVLAQNTNDAPAALDFLSRARAEITKAERVDPALEASVLGNLAYAYHLNGRAREAESAFAQSLARFAAIGRAEHPNAIAIREQWALARFTTGDVTGALALFDEALAMAGKHASPSELPLSLLADRALALDALARYDEARAAYDRVIAVGEQRQDASAVAFALVGKAKVFIGAGDLEQAQRLLDQALGLRGNAIPPDSPTSMNAEVVRARLAAARGHLDEAETGFTRLVEFWDTRKIVTGATWSALRDRADVYLRQGRLDAARADAQRALGIARSVQGDRAYSSMTGLTLALLSRIDSLAGHPDDARREANEALSHLSRGLGDGHPETRRAREQTGG